MGEMATIDGRYVVCWLHMIAEVRLPTEIFVFEGVRPGGVIVLPTRVELVELMGRIGRWVEKGVEEDL